MKKLATHKLLPDKSNRERDIFNSALDRETPAERAAYLDGACGDDAELRARLDTLLLAHDQVGGFLPVEDAKSQAGAPLRPLSSGSAWFE
jgi:hypothetical protein